MQGKRQTRDPGMSQISRTGQPLPALAFLGPEGSFSHQAAASYFGDSVLFHAVHSIEEVFLSVERGDCLYGTVPVENAYEGSVNTTLDLFYKYKTCICAEIFQPIGHHLLSKAEHLEDIKQVFSHQQALAQCGSWLDSRLQGIPRIEVASTSLAAKIVALEPDAAAVGSRAAGEKYGLNILGENIENHPDNVTRFHAIGKSPATPTGRDKASLLFCPLKNPGSLYKALASLEGRGVHMTRIESRPLKTKKWEYMFFVDIDGHQEDPNVRRALEDMQEYCAFIKRLGSYPSGSHYRKVINAH